MNIRQTGAGILGAGTLIMGGVDAAVLDEQPLQRSEIIGEERVEAKQIGNRIETTFPWKDQDGFKVVVDLGQPTIGERIADKRKREVITETVDFGEGGFKIDILLNEKPDTNIFCYLIEGAENYDFFYQAVLTEEEIKQETERPDDIVGSYAVYHKSLKNDQYKTGKVMHIPRPQVWGLSDKEKTKEWAELSYNDGELCVTVEKEYLDNSEYPVRVDPTFGYTGSGGSSDSNATRMEGSEFPSGSAGEVTQLSAYQFCDGVFGDSFTKAAILNASGTLLSGGATQQKLQASAAWTSYTFTSNPVIADANYILVWLNDGGCVAGAFYFDTGTTGQGLEDLNSNNFNNPHSPTNVVRNDRRYSIYATYTSGSSPAQDVIFFD